MAATKRTIPARVKGYEPAFGQADPNDTTGQGVKLQPVTHYAAGGAYGPVCGLKPTPSEASAYDPDDPTCPRCAQWLSAVRKHTAQAHAGTIAAAQAADKRAAVAAAPTDAPPSK